MPTPDGPEVRGSHYFLPLERVLFGPGSLNELAGEVDRLGSKRAFLITGRSLSERSDLVERVSSLLGEQLVGVFAEIRQHTPGSDVERAARAAHAARADLLLSLGGGSPIDGAKAVARALKQAGGRLPMHLAIPTTLSAAEFSHRVGVTDEATKAKTGFADPQLAPRSVILDAEVTLATPMEVWLSSGVRALDHAVETLYSPGFHPLPDVLALEAGARLTRLLPSSRGSPEDIGVRTELQLAAWMSYFGQVNTPMGMSHNLGRRIGATFGVLHGITSCITLPGVMRAMAERRPAALATLGRRLGAASPDAPDAEAARAAAADVVRLVGELGLPGRLRQVGVPRQALDDIAASAYPEGDERNLARRLLEEMW
jgi:alcohol dehydrogenase class IV